MLMDMAYKHGTQTRHTDTDTDADTDTDTNTNTDMVSASKSLKKDFRWYLCNFELFFNV